MRRLSGYVPILGVWLLALAAAVGITLNGQGQERDRLFERFQNRTATGASFVSAYVDDIFRTEGRLAAEMSSDSWRLSDFAPTSELLGFPVGVLLDREGAAVAVAPDAPALVGTDLASRYRHLSGALAGRPTVSDVVSSAAAGKPIVAFALPLTTGRYGVLSLGFSPADGPLKSFLQRQPIADTRGYILDSTGTTIVTAGGGGSGRAVAPARLRSALDHPTTADGRLLSASRIAGTPWTYVLDAPLAAVLTPAVSDDRSQWALLGTLATAVLGAVLVAKRALRSRSRARAAKAQADHRLRLTVQHAPIGMAMVSLDGQLAEPNAHLCEMLGYPDQVLAGMTFDEVTHVEDLEMDAPCTSRLLAGEINSYELEKRFVRCDGTVLWGRLAVSLVRSEEDVPLYYVVQIEDVTAFRAAQAELEHRALYDPLTELANRSLLMDRLSEALASSRAEGEVGIGFCDVDHFKKINDTYGHHAGDQVLQEVARRLRGAVRAGDTVARMGGDEFIVLLTDLGSRREAEQVLERASRAVAEPMDLGGQTVAVGMSRGLALNHSVMSAETLLRNADAALYAAKNSGRGGCVVHHSLLDGIPSEPAEVLPAGPGGPVSRRSGRTGGDNGPMERLIQEILEDDAVHLAYQPVFNLSTGLVVGAEALLRLTDRSGQPIPPSRVIPVAEASGQIADLGRSVLRLAALQCAEWLEDHGVLLPVAVNVSAAQLGLPSFPAEVLGAVELAGVPAEALVIELTESVLLRTGSGGMKQLSELRDAGIELAIDDFGTGYASLSLLHQLPAATLKIDQSFVSGIPDDPRAMAIVAGVIELARSLGMHCIAEGIERETQRDYLARRGVLGQGFLLGRPDDDTVISQLLHRTGTAHGFGDRDPHPDLQHATSGLLVNPLRS